MHCQPADAGTMIRYVHWWIQQARDSAAEAQAADPSPENMMAAAQVEALVSMAEALHRIAAAIENHAGPQRTGIKRPNAD
ncbi:hypothetical protein Arub01_02550 [Actinomadura rubrobrunea]|uniref:Uncharacterized protein n=1 Tax=Actinomadura rubrobrunea TaxID=115335 RepID=A0A9W6URV6_9ACTN|nr:hypothetical protein Arub01_02550 [Actinomadura rubrobrunea]